MFSLLWNAKRQTNLQIIGTFVVAYLTALILTSCSTFQSGPTQATYKDVPDSDYALWSEKGKRLTHWNSSSERAAAPKLTYKELVFYPPAERKRMKKQIEEMSINKALEQVNTSSPQLTLLNGGKILVSGGYVIRDKHIEIVSDLAIIDPKKNSLTRLGQLAVPREDHSVVQLKNGCVLLIGGETERKYADEGTTI